MHSSCNTSRKSQKIFHKVSHIKPFDAIIVPGIPFKNGQWDSVMKARVLWSYILYKDGYTKNIIYSGGAVYTPYIESVIMGLYAQQLGVPSQHIFYDTQARHSTENIYYSYLIAKEQGFKKIALATDPFQSFMLRSFTKKRFATRIYHLPFVRDSIAAYNYLNPLIDPATAFIKDFTPITEEETTLQRFKGTLGHNIDWKGHKNRKLGPL